MSEQIEDQKSGTKQPQTDFLDFITRMCGAQNWKITESDNEHAIIQFAVNEARSQTLFIFSFDDALEFSVPSFAAFDSLEDVPHLISSTLLQVNAKTKIGFWCLEQIGDHHVYTFMHNTSITGMTESVFGEIATALIQRVEEFENLLTQMSGEASKQANLPG
jgi:hypothetical protein